MSVSNDFLARPSARPVQTEGTMRPTEFEAHAVSHGVPASVEVKATVLKLGEFATLAKPEITLMVMISAGLACLLASDSFHPCVLANAILGTGLVAAGAGALNQYLERAADARMRRTSRRPLPSGHVTAAAALFFGISLSVGGTIYLSFLLNPLTGLLGILTLVTYLFAYTPLKGRTSLCTLVGAIPGAAPMLIGWAGC